MSFVMVLEVYTATAQSFDPEYCSMLPFHLLPSYTKNLQKFSFFGFKPLAMRVICDYQAKFVDPAVPYGS